MAQGEGGGAYGTREGGELEGLRSSGLRSGGEEGSYDRIVCDVPCSGDGTTRKNPSIWHRSLHINPFGTRALGTRGMPLQWLLA